MGSLLSLDSCTARVVRRGGLAVNYSAVVLSDDSSHIWHATVTNLQRVGVEDLVQLRSLREVFKHKGAKSSADVRCIVLAEGWVKPNNAFMSVFSGSLCLATSGVQDTLFPRQIHSLEVPCHTTAWHLQRRPYCWKCQSNGG